MFVRTETAFAYARLFTVCRERGKSQCRTIEQFEALSDLVTENWASTGEPEYAQWLDDEYLTDPWDLWFYAASGTPGVVPNQHPIESHHRAIKATAVDHLRAATSHVLAGTLPKILVECAMDIGSDRIRHYASGPVSAEVLGAAVVRDDNLHGLKVNAHRVKTYKASLDGTLNKDEKVENIQLRYLLLHTVEVLDRVPFDHAWDNPSWSLEEIEVIRSKFKCDCKAFFQSGWLCAHVLACLHLVDSFDLQVILPSLPARKPPARPRKETK
ncbi:hypothetical protein PHYSODRAFT_389368, partial [Phytophthora sojae]